MSQGFRVWVLNLQFLKEFEAAAADSKERIASLPKRKLTLDPVKRYRAKARAVAARFERKLAARRLVQFEKPGICEHGLRSWVSDSPSLQRFVQILPKKVVCGDAKGVVYTEKKKLRALDRKYVTLDKRRLAAIIIDLDHCFGSEWDLREELLKYLPKKMLPSFAPGLTLSDGTFSHPPPVWLLPPDCECGPKRRHTTIRRRCSSRIRCTAVCSTCCCRTAPTPASSLIPTNARTRRAPNGTR